MNHFEEPSRSRRPDPVEGNSVSEVVSHLKDESPSLSWRSNLNEVLRAESQKLQRRKRVFIWLRPAAGLAFAASLAGVVFLHSAADTAGANSLEAKLISEFRSAAATAEVAGPTAVGSIGLAPASTKASNHVRDDEMWNQLADENSITL
jgi:hypothetical protein